MTPWGIREQLAWRGAFSVAVLNACGWLFDVMIARQVPGMPLWPALVASGSGALAAVVLLALRGKASARLSSLIFLAQIAFIICALWYTNARYAEASHPWAPFQADKLGALTVGLLTPELWVGLISIGGYFVAVLTQYALFPPEIRGRMAVGEPWATAVFVFFAVVLLIQTHRRYKLERRAARAKEEAASLERLARAFLAIRDYANTPLQTIDCTTALVALTNPELATTLAPIGRAVDRLRDLNHLLSKLQSRVDWRSGDTSFDPERMLQDVGKDPTPTGTPVPPCRSVS
jgi:hypothetical protein